MILTAFDAIDRTVEFANATEGGGDRAKKLARRALADAVAEFHTLHTWTYYRTLARLNFQPAYKTGTVAYNAATRALTLTGGTWPSWAANGLVLIGTVFAEVASRDSDAVLTLDLVNTYPADFVAGTAYSLILDRYQLPTNFQAARAPIMENFFGGLRYVTPQALLYRQRSYSGTTTWPEVFTIETDSRGRFFLRVSPYPDVAATLDYVYDRMMLPVVYDVGFTDGTAGIISGTNVVTGSGTKFRSNMVGSVLRLGYDLTTPEAGAPVAFESRVVTVAGETSLTVEDNATQTLAAVGVSVSDPLDIDATAMYVAFQGLCDRNAAVAGHMKDAARAEANFQQKLQRAKEADVRYVGPDVAGSRMYGRRARPEPVYPDAT